MSPLIARAIYFSHTHVALTLNGIDIIFYHNFDSYCFVSGLSGIQTKPTASQSRTRAESEKPLSHKAPYRQLFIWTFRNICLRDHRFSPMESPRNTHQIWWTVDWLNIHSYARKWEEYFEPPTRRHFFSEGEAWRPECRVVEIKYVYFSWNCYLQC